MNSPSLDEFFMVGEEIVTSVGGGSEDALFILDSSFLNDNKSPQSFGFCKYLGRCDGSGKDNNFRDYCLNDLRARSFCKYYGRNQEEEDE